MPALAPVKAHRSHVSRMSESKGLPLAHHHHGGRHQHQHERRHDHKVYRVTDHVTKQTEPSAFGLQIHAALWALARIFLTNVGMHWTQIDSRHVCTFVHAILRYVFPRDNMHRFGDIRLMYIKSLHWSVPYTC
jgi:hypothetical protein